MEMVLMLGMMLMMISMIPVTMMMMIATISPAESARRRWLLSSVGFRPMPATKHGNSSPSRVFTPGGSYMQEGHRGGPPGIQEGAWRGQEGAVPGTLLAAWW